MKLRLEALFLVPAAAAALAACGTSSPGAEHAAQVAQSAACSDLEELDASVTDGPWVFTCQIGERTYSVRVFGSAEAARSDPGTAKLPRVVRGDVVVLQAQPPGGTAYDYSAFR